MYITSSRRTVPVQLDYTQGVYERFPTQKVTQVYSSQGFGAGSGNFLSGAGSGSNSSFPHFEVSGFDSSATNSKNKIKRKLLFNSNNAKCLKHDKNPGILPNSQNPGTE